MHSDTHSLLIHAIIITSSLHITLTAHTRDRHRLSTRVLKYTQLEPMANQSANNYKTVTRITGFTRVTLFVGLISHHWSIQIIQDKTTTTKSKQAISHLLLKL